MRIRRLPRAIRDMDEIWDHIARDDPAAADSVIDRITTASARLADFPESGIARPELRKDMRSIPVGRYVLLYRIRLGAVEIARVIHGARDLQRMLDEN